jgi:phage terminase small subunit
MNPVSHVPPPFGSLAKRKREFIVEYVKSGDAKASFLKVGYKDSRTAMSKANIILKEVTPYLQQAQRDYLEGVEMAILGGKVVSELALHADNETVRLNAAKELLSRAAPEKARESTITHVHKTLTNDQVDARIKQLQDELFVDAPQATVVAIK